MVYQRKDIWSFIDPWDPVIDWYEQAVGKLLQLPIEDPRSWLSLAAMHGIVPDGWIAHEYLRDGQVIPDLAGTLWNQCQHQSWYFLPWHRGYLMAFEAILRATIREMHGPEDWALPYWNPVGTYPNSIQLPIAFRQEHKPGGGKNHLYVKARYGTDGKGNIDMDPKRIHLNALAEEDFSDKTGGFGGPETLFYHGGEDHPNGQLESIPHNLVHSFVGGTTVPRPQAWNEIGLMATPDLAALDPIFWIHHANIDRLWEVWRLRDPLNKDPVSNNEWMNGPPVTGRKFLMPTPDGALIGKNVAEMADMSKLDYDYDDTSDPIPGVSSRRSKPPASFLGNLIGLIVSSGTEPREFAANVGPLQLGVDGSESAVRIDRKSMPKSAAMQGFSISSVPVSRVYLSLDGIKSDNDAAVFDVFVSAPAVLAIAAQEHYVGSVSLFGAKRASDTSLAKGGSGITQTLDITDSYQELQLSGALNTDEVIVKFRKISENSDLTGISVSKVRLIHKS